MFSEIVIWNFMFNDFLFFLQLRHLGRQWKWNCKLPMRDLHLKHFSYCAYCLINFISSLIILFSVAYDKCNIFYPFQDSTV